MRFPIGAMTVGDVLDRGVRLFIGRLTLLLGINVLVMLPILIFSLVQPFLLQAMVESARGGGGPSLGPVIGFFGGTFAALAIYALVLPFGVAATLTVTIREYLGQSATVGDALGSAFRRFLPLLGTTIIAWILTMLGSMLCCIPGIYVGILFLFVSQIVVAESTAGVPALNRSASLVGGHWWRIFGVNVLVLLISAIVQGIVIGPLSFLLPAQETVMSQTGPVFIFNLRNQIIHALVGFPFQVVFQAFHAVCTTLLYLDMRIRKEGLDLQIAAEQMEHGGGEAL